MRMEKLPGLEWSLDWLNPPSLSDKIISRSNLKWTSKRWLKLIDKWKKSDPKMLSKIRLMIKVLKEEPEEKKTDSTYSFYTSKINSNQHSKQQITISHLLTYRSIFTIYVIDSLIFLSMEKLVSDIDKFFFVFFLSFSLYLNVFFILFVFFLLWFQGNKGLLF